MIATIHVADVGAASTLGTMLRRRQLRSVPGLHWGDIAVLAPLATTRPPALRRIGLFGFWDDDASVDAFVADHPLAPRFAGGFHARLAPLRAFGSWPGLPADLPRSRAVAHDGPVVVLTLAQLRLSQLVRFIKTSRPAERAATQSDGLVWATAAARPPFVATISLWRSSEASAAYAFGDHGGHPDAIVEQRRKDFHRESAFVRFSPLRMEGGLDGVNPLVAAELPRS